MGYDSTFSGSMRPGKIIPADLVMVINDADLDVKVADANDENGEPGDIIPACLNMHGYNMVQDLFKVQKKLAQWGIKLTGEIERVGENSDDFELIEMVRGRLYTRAGEVKYGSRKKIDSSCVTKYYIKAMRCCGNGGFKRAKFAGWLGQKLGKGGATYYRIGNTAEHKLNEFSPPIEAVWFYNREDAEAAARKYSRYGACELVAVEDSL